MDKQLEKFFSENEKKLEEQKEKHLISLGLYYAEYLENNDKTDEYCHYDFYRQDYYKKVPISVTDDEYEKIKEISKFDKRNKKPNKIAELLIVFAVLNYIVGFIIGLVIGSLSGSAALILIYWATFFSSGSVFLGLGEIIKLLDKISKK